MYGASHQPYPAETASNARGAPPARIYFNRSDGCHCDSRHPGRACGAQDYEPSRSGAQALKLYRLDNGRYPTQEQGLRALIEKPSIAPMPHNWKDGGYLESLPSDP